jgi:FKBP-type peptidyl-prolyl cis-trans isomerase FkpA
MHMSVRPVRALVVSLLLAVVAGCGSSSPTQPTPAPPALNVPFSQTDIIVGEGPAAVAGNRLTVHYALWHYDAAQPENKGRLYQTSVNGPPFVFVLGTGAVIAGWEQGIPGMRVGGLRRLVIPPALAYGAQGSGPIPGNATLVFDVELLAIQ